MGKGDFNSSQNTHIAKILTHFRLNRSRTLHSINGHEGRMDMLYTQHFPTKLVSEPIIIQIPYRLGDLPTLEAEEKIGI